VLFAATLLRNCWAEEPISADQLMGDEELPSDAPYDVERELEEAERMAIEQDEREASESAGWVRELGVDDEVDVAALEVLDAEAA
jgi:hypothetical protein